MSRNALVIILILVLIGYGATILYIGPAPPPDNPSKPEAKYTVPWGFPSDPSEKKFLYRTKPHSSKSWSSSPKRIQCATLPYGFIIKSIGIQELS